MYFYCKEQGLTLFELITTICILTIICLISLPHYHNWMQKQEIRIISSGIQQHVSYARSQALVRHTTVVICSSEDLIRCEKDKWNKGLLIFTDKNKNKQVDSEDHILLKTENKIKYGKLTWVGSASSRDVLTLQGDTGLPRGSPGSFYYCSQYDEVNNKRYKIGRMGAINLGSPPEC
ncbi:putative type 4 fimbrial biogenesis protein FimT [Acinetobacter guillouiae MSP4-18]|nr:hypothetical protein F981_03254 [Acinetobacter guillouiae CIP 63.46]EPH38193.1 putative type 4 fimbrial biogenesis protein FimT [Acinetobacter guillouiae MSP4-18]KAB0625694.1 fimbrial biogenesis protein FimT [Acinetobacter guillouiae]